jgi:hypothetical protein
VHWQSGDSSALIGAKPTHVATSEAASVLVGVSADAPGLQVMATDRSEARTFHGLRWTAGEHV